jgi:hypothetical protein
MTCYNSRYSVLLRADTRQGQLANQLAPDLRYPADAIYCRRMLMVIFGAGASYDSAQAYRPASPGGGSANFGVSAQLPTDEGPWRPPLAKDLFQDRHHQTGFIVNRYPKLTHILPYLREPSNGRSVEEILETLQEESKDSPETKRELASVRFYLCELLNKVTTEWSERTNGVTNYAPLVRDILRFNKPGERVFLVTFNYDLLLERALYTFDFKRRNPEDQLNFSHEILKLFNLHGSVGWSRLLDLPEGVRLSPQNLIDIADTIRMTDNFVLADATNPNDASRYPKSLMPAIAIPVQTKSDEYFECPPTYRDYLVKGLPHVTKILIIGWQAKEAHFLRMLQSNLPQLRHVMVVGANQADANGILNYFSGEIRKRVPDQSAASGGFTDFVVNHRGDDFFKA